MNKRLEILLVEDEPAERDAVIREFDLHSDEMHIAASTDNSAKAFELTCELLPDAVILDLELQLGGGNGLDFLQKLKDAPIPYKPHVLVSTYNTNKEVRDTARSLGAAFVMSKTQKGFSPADLTAYFATIKAQILAKRDDEQESPLSDDKTQREKRLRRLIAIEFGKLGMSNTYVGYKYLIEGVICVINKERQHIPDIVGKVFKKGEDSVERAMQNAINRTWNSAAPETLLKHYTAKIKSERGVPTLTEFMFYYAELVENKL